MKNYQRTITCDVSKAKAYKVITEEMSNWWSQMTAPFLKVGDKSKIDFGGSSYWVFEASKLEDSELVELICCEANHLVEGMGDQILTEWLHTLLRFEIVSNENITNIIFTHLGLTTDLHCYDICKSGWDYYLTESLKDYLSK